MHHTGLVDRRYERITAYLSPCFPEPGCQRRIMDEVCHGPSNALIGMYSMAGPVSLTISCYRLLKHRPYCNLYHHSTSTSPDTHYGLF